ETRAETAAILLIRHRSCPGLVAETESVAIPAEENRLILRGLAESDWRYQGPRPLGTYAPLASLAFMHLGLTEKDGWVEPVVVNNPGTPPPDRGVVVGDAFAQWLDGPGKDYKVKKLVPKKTDR
ncbi:MAG TPA: hypothetical protein VM529_10655, partial [Gemmata sp.]|nr:hypothetical protein [Gemmata sp.]